MDVSELGEFGLIERLRGLLPAPQDGPLIVGIGDDAAVWRTGSGYVIATTDTMVAGVHFLPGRVSWHGVGWKALAGNVSDIAAMGGAPTFALVTLALPPDTRVEHLDELYAGIRECAKVYGVTVAGGDIVSAPVFSIAVALCGEPRVAEDGEPLLLRRDAARPGDLVAVSAALGGPVGGLRLLQAGRADTEEERALIEAHTQPWPRVDAGDIAVLADIRCGMDISDGLVQDLRHICRASEVDAEIAWEAIPLYPGLEAAFPDDARALAATGGEDYELLLVAPSGNLARADHMLRDHLNLPDDEQVIVIGRITGAGEGRVRVIDAGGTEIDLPSGGWDHLRDRA